jgi:hypothetical protein
MEEDVVYEPLPIVTADLDDLRLDLDNYRIPTHREDEPAALAYLFASEDVLSTARLILRDGYFDNEVPIVVADGESFLVLEGNRRVSALKALQDPDLVPNHADEVRALLRRYAIEADNLPTAIRVLVAESRDQAAPHVARLHTGLSKRRWSVDQQANYYYSLLGPQTTVDDVKARYPDVTVVRFMRMAVMRRFLAGVRFSDETLRDYVAGEAPKLTMSSFEYAYRHSDIATAMGASFDDEGQLLPRRKRPDKIGAELTSAQRAAVEYLMVEFRANRLNTRSLELRKGTAEQAALVARLLRATPQPDPEPTNPTDETHEAHPEDDPTVDERSGGAQDDGGERAGASRGPNHPDTKDSLQFGGLDYTTHTSPGLQRRYHELRRVSLGTLPTAAAMLLRSVLETTVKYHFESTSTPATGELKASFKVVVDTYGNAKDLRHAINMIYSGQGNLPGSIAWFNLVSHSADLVVKAQDVRDAYGRLEPVLRRLLRPATPPTP